MEQPDIVWRTIDGDNLEADLYSPPVVKKGLGALLAVHGGGFSHENIRRGSISKYAELLAAGGYVVMNLDYRTGTVRAFYQPAYDDVLAAVDWLRTDARAAAYVDPDRIGIIGWSAGGVMAEVAAVQGVVAAAASVSGQLAGVSLGRPSPDSAPLYMAHADEDKNVPILSDEKTEEAYGKAGVPVRLENFKGGAHGTHLTTKHPEIIDHALAWFGEHL